MAPSHCCAERSGSLDGSGQRGLVDADGLASRAGGSAFAGGGAVGAFGVRPWAGAVAEQGMEGTEAVQDRAFSDTLYRTLGVELTVQLCGGYECLRATGSSTSQVAARGRPAAGPGRRCGSGPGCRCGPSVGGIWIVDQIIRGLDRRRRYRGRSRGAALGPRTGGTLRTAKDSKRQQTSRSAVDSQRCAGTRNHWSELHTAEATGSNLSRPPANSTGQRLGHHSHEAPVDGYGRLGPHLVHVAPYSASVRVRLMLSAVVPAAG